jgi:hypothetical protein
MAGINPEPALEIAYLVSRQRITTLNSIMLTEL